MTKNQEAMVKEFIDECKADNVPKEHMTGELAGFLRSLGNQERDRTLHEVAADFAAVAELVKKYY